MADTIGSIKYDFTIDTSKASQGVSSAKKAASDVAKSAEAAANQSDNKFAAAWAKIGDGATKAAKKIGTALLNISKTAAVAGAGAATAMATASVKMYADYEQNIGGVETLFKDAAGTVEQFANDAFKNAGMSANQYMETVTSFSARLLQGLGGDTEKAAQISNMAVEDMSDNANKMGTSMEAIQNAYQGFAKQNYTMLDNLKLGYGGTASEMARLINDSGVLGDTMQVTANNVNEVSFDKMIEAIHKVQDNMGITGTTAKEAAETISGSAKMMRASWDNLLTFVGSGKGNIDEVMDQFIDSVKTFGKNVIPVAKRAIKGLAEVVAELAPTISAELPGIVSEILPLVIEAAIQITAGLIKALPSIIQGLADGIFGAVKAIFKENEALGATILAFFITLGTIVMSTVVPAFVAWSAAMLANPITWIVLGVTALIAGLILLVTHIEEVGAFFGEVFKNIGKIVGDVANNIGQFFNAAFQWVIGGVTELGSYFANIFNNIGTIAMGIVSRIRSAFQGAVDFIRSIFQGLYSFFVGVFSTIGNFFAGVGNAIGNAVGGAFRAVVNSVLGFVEGFINIPVNAINGLIDVINAVPGVDIGYLPTMSFPRLASGGIVPSTPGGQIIMAGEAGEDEWVVPESKMASMIEQLESRRMGAGGGITINVSGVFATSPTEQRKVAEQIYQRLQELDRARFGGASI